MPKLGAGALHLDRIIQSRMRPLLESQAIALLDSEWLLKEWDGTRMLCRQELPPEAFLSLEDLEHDVLRYTADGEVEGTIFTNVIALSYMWLNPDHPDPNGTTLQLVLRAMSMIVDHWTVLIDGGLHWFSKRFGLFWDYASLFQKPRTTEQEKLFRDGLEGISYLYMHPCFTVFVVDQFPEGFDAVGHNALPYTKRGWTYTERCWSTAAKTGTGGVHFLSNMKESDVRYSDIMGQDSKAFACPVEPGVFCLMLDQLSFTNGKDDREIVKRLYSDSFILLYQHATSLAYIAANWSDAVGTVVVSGTLARGMIPKLEQLTLSFNKLGIGFCQALTSAANHCPHLSFLDLSSNPIGDEGFCTLIPFLPRIKRVVVQNVGLTEKSVTELATRCCLYHTFETCLLETLFLQENEIQSHDSVNFLVMSASASLKNLDISMNPFCNDELSLRACLQYCSDHFASVKVTHNNDYSQKG